MLGVPKGSSSELGKVAAGSWTATSGADCGDVEGEISVYAYLPIRNRWATAGVYSCPSQHSS